MSPGQVLLELVDKLGVFGAETWIMLNGLEVEEHPFVFDTNTV